jgi:hypothetical protein
VYAFLTTKALYVPIQSVANCQTRRQTDKRSEQSVLLTSRKLKETVEEAADASEISVRKISVLKEITSKETPCKGDLYHFVNQYRLTVTDELVDGI